MDHMLSSTNNTDTGAADGLWTGFDWSNTQVGVKDGVPYSKDADIMRKINSPQVLLGTFSNSSNRDGKDNVKRVKSVFGSDKWPSDAAAVYTYDDFLRAVAKFPKFCNELPAGSTAN